MVSADEAKQLFDIERLIQKELERELIDDFTPNHDLPKSRALLPAKSKRPKKPNKSDSQGKRNNNNGSQGHGAKNNEGRREDQKKSNKAKKRVFWNNNPNRKPKA